MNRREALIGAMGFAAAGASAGWLSRRAQDFAAIPAHALPKPGAHVLLLDDGARGGEALAQALRANRPASLSRQRVSPLARGGFEHVADVLTEAGERHLVALLGAGEAIALEALLVARRSRSLARHDAAGGRLLITARI